MLFCSQAYLVFLASVFALYWAIPWHRVRVWLLLAASIAFYASWNQWLALLIVASTTIDYVLARWIDASASARLRKSLLVVSVCGNLGLLGYFKYANFFLASLNAGLAAVGAEHSFSLLQVILPIGISFYTFESINYMVDVYRRRLPAERSLPDLLLFITFFPHLVAGPIVRARDFLPQIRRPKRWDWARINLGVQLLLLGTFKKLAIADRMACFVDPIFEHPAMYPSHAHWMAMFAYALQIYGDFSGYTDMALGSAHLLGYKLTKNFDMPYLARNIADFWRRWHISLSSWLRDYLFIPLGGSRCAPMRTVFNLMATMTLAGLWHGASWTFVVWGAIQGVWLVGHRVFSDIVRSRPRLERALQTNIGTMGCVLATFLTVTFSWVLFRSPDFGTALEFWAGLFTSSGSMRSPVHPSGLLLTYAMATGGCWVALQPRFRRWTRTLPAPVAGMGYATVASLAAVLAPASGKVFIYFQF